MKTIIAVLFTIFIFGCEDNKRKYIETDRGFISYSRAYCDLGMLLNNDGKNIMDEKLKPITCSGYVYLTKEEINKLDIKQ